MNTVFETFKPENDLVAKYVDYYYLDIKPHNVKTEFDCFPHYNNSISLYKSNISPKKGEVIFKKNAGPLQIFTPIRENILNVQQFGEIHRIVIVFKPLGVQQFYKNLNFTEFITDYNFFTKPELSKLFATRNNAIITTQLEQSLLHKFEEYKNNSLEKALILILDNSSSLAVQDIATEIKISRRHLNRLFNSHFGVSVKKFDEIVRFRKTFKSIYFKNPEQRFTDLAYEFNYSDQSHLNKIFRSFTSNSPNKFLKKGTHLGNEDTFWHLKK